MRNSKAVKEIRTFNRFYTNIIGVVDRHILHTPYSLTEARVLFEIFYNSNCTAGKIKKILQVDEGYLSRMIDKLIEQGLITRKQSRSDGRVLILSLSKKGEREYQKINQGAEASIESIFDPPHHKFRASLPHEDMNRKPTPFTYFALGLSLLAWASAFTGVRASLQAYMPGHLILLRFLIASSLLAGYAALSKMRMPVWKDLPAILLLGLAGFTVYQVGLAFGEVTVSAGAASLLIASAPIFTAIVSYSVLHERLNTMTWLGIGVSFVGVILIVWGEGNGIQFHVGPFLILLSALSESLYFVFQKPYLKKYRAIELTAYTIWAATMFMLVFTPGLGIAIQTAPLFATLSVVYLGIVPTVLAYLTWNIALARMPASVATTFLYLLPVLALIVAWFWLGEIPTLLAIIGGVLTLVGVAVVNWKGYNENKSIIQIRLAEASEVASIASILHQAFVEYESLYTPEAFSATTPTTEQMRLRWGEGPVWVAVQNDNIVGTVSAVPKSEGLYIRSMAVLPMVRGQGIGRLLLQATKEFARARGCQRLFLSTTPFLLRAIRLYEHFGFRQSDEGANNLFGTPLFTMVKTLELSGEMKSKLLMSKETAEHYIWGKGCDGRHLVKTAELSVIHERMPVGTSEARHLHRRARQFFFVLSGTAVLVVASVREVLRAHEGLEVPPGVPHQMFNESEQTIEFLVVSQPASHDDRVLVGGDEI